MSVGARVLRGPDWAQSEADGGEGHLGTVVGFKAEEGTAEVVWDNGQVTTCRVGKEGKHDLKILDSGSAGVTQRRFRCDGCNRHPIHGMRWACDVCQEFDLCSLCYVMGKHDLSHDFRRFSKDGGQGTLVGRRSGARKVRIVGIFPGARVTRGRDWLAANADGGEGGVGTVVEVVSPESNSARNAVRVSWDSGQSLQHRLGLHGKVDLVLHTESKVKPSVYIDHLPVMNQEHVGGRRKDEEIVVGDSVMVEVEEDTFAEIQKQGCGWTIGMKKCLGKAGVVKAITAKGDVDVDFDGQKWRISRTALRKGTEGARHGEIRQGDTVRLLEDEERVQRLQNHHGGWNSAIKTCLGKVGRVSQVHPSGDLKVNFGIFDWHLNPLCCVPAPGCDPESPDLQDPVFRELLQSELLSRATGTVRSSRLRDKVKGELKDGDASPSMVRLIKAIMAGDLSKIRIYLDQEPGLVHQTCKGASPLHGAAEAGEVEIARLLLDRGADVNKVDKDGHTPLIIAANKGYLGMAKFLLERGANVNMSNENSCTALHQAAWNGSTELCRLLMDNGASLHKKDANGNTPVFVAVDEKDQAEALEVLLSSPEVNVYQTNRKDFNILHLAAYRGHPKCAAVIIKRDSTVVNCPTGAEQWGAIHIAAVNDHTDVLRILLEAGAAINARNHENVTPLHLACKNSHIDCVMMLVERGAEIDALDDDKDTPLHKALIPQSDSSRRNEDSRLQVANYLLHHGASVNIRNRRGQTALEGASGNLRRGVEAFIGESGIAAKPTVSQPPPPSQPPTPVAKENETSKNNLPEETARNIQETVVSETACVTCSRRDACVVFLPCAHKASCMECAHAHTTCPVCHGALISKIDLDGNTIRPSAPASGQTSSSAATGTADDKKCELQ